MTMLMTTIVMMMMMQDRYLRDDLPDPPDPQYTETKSSLLRRKNSKAKVNM
jgi:hypothetical protein